MCSTQFENGHEGEPKPATITPDIVPVLNPDPHDLGIWLAAVARGQTGDTSPWSQKAEPTVTNPVRPLDDHAIDRASLSQL